MIAALQSSRKTFSLEVDEWWCTCGMKPQVLEALSARITAIVDDSDRNENGKEIKDSKDASMGKEEEESEH